MKTETKRNRSLGRWMALLLPLALTGLFYLLRENRAAMDWWVFQILRPAAQGMGRLWAVVPFSGMELVIALFLLGNLAWLIRAVIFVVRGGKWHIFGRRMLALAAAWAWAWCGLCWLWNVTYYASTFTQRSGLTNEPYSVEKLAAVTEYFAQNAARLSSQVQRDEGGHFAEDLKGCFARGPEIYDAIAGEFPCLNMHSVKAKPLLCSRLQSLMGFTGMYFPFTGEANINVDAPACLVPVTIAHEMSHQRMVASELEANFVGIAACITSEDVAFQYSGYMMGLIHLCNALYPVDADAWYDVAGRTFTPELSTDWDDNNAFWRSLDSKVEEVAEKTYDTFLKGNDQALGMRSYGACVDLLVSYFGPLAEG